MAGTWHNIYGADGKYWKKLKLTKAEAAGMRKSNPRLVVVENARGRKPTPRTSENIRFGIRIPTFRF